jgi:hypothetical protein
MRADPSWRLDGVAHAGAQHLDAGYVAGPDEKSQTDWREDIEALLELGIGAASTDALSLLRLLIDTATPARTSVGIATSMYGTSGPGSAWPCSAWSPQTSSSKATPAAANKYHDSIFGSPVSRGNESR